MQRRWVSMFQEGSAEQRDLLGGKGANLAEMARIGLPVPPGFTVTTEACRAYLTSGGQVPLGLWDEVRSALGEVERAMGRRYGEDADPLLLSVRSGAKFSMPGMMDTVLDLGLTEVSAAGLATSTNEHFALDSYRRLLQMFGKVVLGVDADLFEAAITDTKRAAGVTYDFELREADLKCLVARFKEIIAAAGFEVPGDPFQQLQMAVMAVFNSWHTPRARAYRHANHIAEDLGTAVNVQAMVFGNIGSDSASGVAFTRNPNTGESGLFGEYLTEAQGEDVVAGVRTPRPLAEMGNDALLSDAHRELVSHASRLEHHYRDMQDLEFTVERGRLWMLQTRTGKRTAQAAVRIAVEMAGEGLIERRTAVQRVEPAQLEQLLHPRIDESQPFTLIATGLPASPGAATGTVVFEPAEARERGSQGESVILVRAETSADDFPGIEKSRGILTARGGMTSHAAVVARGMGKPAITGCAAIEIDPAGQWFTIGNVTINAGDEITIDGTTGRVFQGRVAMVEPGLSKELDRLLSWADRFRRLGVQANADTPRDARRARESGAEGVGLCRTEHMFFGEGRIEAVQAMILATNDEERETALARIEPLQTADFAAIFREMAGRPVTIRLLDPPLHEFLPEDPAEIAAVAAGLGLSADAVSARIDSLREANPMLGHRGCRLGIAYPAITRMQARAILNAALISASAGVDVEPEIMVPLVADPDELRRQRALIEETAEEVFAAQRRRLPYRVGTMIELPRAALLADRIARFADFFSFGTNDLTQTTYGLSRDDAGRFLPLYIEQGIFPADPFQVLDRDGVGQLIATGVRLGRQTKPGLQVGICGEHGGDPSSIAFAHEVGLDYVSCSPFRLPIARLAAAQAALGPVSRDV
ncbi:MAG: pyruvate, phosphate dikinase [Thermomicrobiales bacterium]